MGLWNAVRHHKLLVASGVLAGAILMIVWTYSFSWNTDGPVIAPRTQDNYVTNVSAVIDTADFGLGRSDTDVYRLALMAPTYAQLMVSEPVLQAAEKALGRPIDAVVQAEPVANSPIVRLTVQGVDRDSLDDTALAVVEAFRNYISDNQVVSEVPDELRLTIRGIDRPTPAEPSSNRSSEIAVLLFFLPIAVAAAFAMRLERSLAATPPAEPREE